MKSHLQFIKIEGIYLKKLLIRFFNHFILSRKTLWMDFEMKHLILLNGSLGSLFKFYKDNDE